MRKLGLNTATIKENLDSMVKAGLLVLTDQPKIGRYEYRTTEKGKIGLKQYYLLVSQFFVT
jgi:predicted transcriptional regulator